MYDVHIHVCMMYVRACLYVCTCIIYKIIYRIVVLQYFDVEGSYAWNEQKSLSRSSVITLS
jgi:hypothetical protein